MISRSNDIILLLGAGASVDAGIPASQTMIDKIEGLLETRPDWKEFRDLYFLVKSSILYIFGLRGQFNARDFYWRVEGSCRFRQLKDIRIGAKSGADFGGEEFLEDYALG